MEHSIYHKVLILKTAVSRKKALGVLATCFIFRD